MSKAEPYVDAVAEHLLTLFVVLVLATVGTISNAYSALSPLCLRQVNDMWLIVKTCKNAMRNSSTGNTTIDASLAHHRNHILVVYVEPIFIAEKFILESRKPLRKLGLRLQNRLQRLGVLATVTCDRSPILVVKRAAIHPLVNAFKPVVIAPAEFAGNKFLEVLVPVGMMIHAHVFKRD